MMTIEEARTLVSGDRIVRRFEATNFRVVVFFCSLHSGPFKSVIRYCYCLEDIEYSPGFVSPLQDCSFLPSDKLEKMSYDS